MQFVTLRFCDVSGFEARLKSPFRPSASYFDGAKVSKVPAQTLRTIVPTLRVGMQFVTLCVTQRFCDVSEFEARLKSPFRPSASYFDGAKVTKPPGSVSGPTSSGSFVLTLIRG